MGFILPDIARTPEDFAQCENLLHLTDASGLVPPFGRPGNVTYVIRDEDNRTLIRAGIHVEHALEVRGLWVDPSYEHQQICLTILHRGMEMNMRSTGVERYYFTVNKENKRVIRILEKDRARIIDMDSVRFAKEL